MFNFLLYRVSIFFLLGILLLLLPRRYGWGKTLAALAVCLVVTRVIDWYTLLHCPNDGYSLLGTVIEIVTVQATAFYISSYRDARALFTGLSAAALVLPGNIVATVVHLVTPGPVAPLAVQVCIHSLLLLCLWRLIRTDYRLALQSSIPFWRELCLIPALCYGALFALSVWPSNIYACPQNAVASIVILLLMLAAYLLVITLYRQQVQEIQLSNAVEHLQQYAGTLKQSLEEQRKAELSVTVLRHDLRHYMTLARSYFDAGDTEAIDALFEKIGVEAESTRVEHYCANVAIDGALRRFAAMADKRGVRFLCEAEIPEALPFDEFAFAAVLSNLVENAIQAAAELPAAKQPYVQFTAHTVKSQLAVSIANPYQAKPEVSLQTGLPLTQKGEGHGYGMRSVQAFARSTGATFDYDMQGQVFHVRLLVEL